ncbi:MAG: MSMEG_4193 family putative phosphomutase [Chloroflexi bacterium]|nr:MSMEG_4193 family putative phosphomutase [Chloroflexota bacterium]
MVGKRLAGWTPGVHLNERGRQQAEALARRLQKAPIKAVYSSPLERALETAAPLAAAKGLPVIERPGLGEMQYGKWTGKSLRELSQRTLWPTIQHAPSLVRFPGGESFPEAQARAATEIERLRAGHTNQMIACFSHSDIIKLIVSHYLGLALDLFQRLHVSPASISVLNIVGGQAMLVRLNDTGADQHPGSN